MRILLGTCAALFFLAAPLAAQACQPPMPCRLPPEPGPPQWRGEVGTVAINSLLGGLTAGVARSWSGGSFGEGFVHGAAGGAVTYAGKRVAVERFDGAGLLGRQIAAVGASEVRSAARGAGVLSEVAFPLGPVRVYAGRDTRPLVRVDAGTVVAGTVTAFRAGTRFDAGASLSAGAPVFRTRRLLGDPVMGSHVAGVIMLAGDGVDAPLHTVVFAHERVHVLQHDQAFLSWGAPVEERLLAPWRARLPGLRHLDLGAHVLPWVALNHAIPYQMRPWEREAYFLAGEEGGHDFAPQVKARR